MGLNFFLTWAVLACLWNYGATEEGTFSFASYYGDHMVLQRGPQRANIWGYSSTIGDNVTVTLGNEQPVTTTVVSGPVSIGGIWSVKLPAITQPGPYYIKAESWNSTISLSDVLFGDIWICSGQSNMKVTVSMAYNATEEIKDADNYPNIRVMTVGTRASSTQQLDLMSILQHWSVGSSESVGGPDWNYFSALCWFYGRYLYQHRGYPIGLIDNSWGGTGIEPWTSKEGLQKCNVNVTENIVMATPAPGTYYVPGEPTVVWNSMMAPLAKMTIYGVIWYQGETNTRDPIPYKCYFPEMINDWRAKFNIASNSETDAMFPFGFAQLSAWERQSGIGGFPQLRWSQTADFGYVPNSVMKNVFMAVTMDLPDIDSPYNSTHPKNKQDIALRLGLAGEAVAYGVVGVRYQGPFPTTISVNPSTGMVNIEFDQGGTPVDVRNKNGFEVCCSANIDAKCEKNDPEWKATPIVGVSSSAVNVAYKPNCETGSHVLGIRYAWSESPCPSKQCAVYSKVNGLPAPPYITRGIYA